MNFFFRRLFFPPVVRAVFSGVLLWLCFPNFLEKSLKPSTAPLVWVALVPFFTTLEESSLKKRMFLSAVFAFTFFAGLLYWVAFLEEAGSLRQLAWVMLSLVLSLYFLFFAGSFTLLRRFEVPFSFSCALSWLAAEKLREVFPWGGFPWGALGYAHAGGEFAAHAAPWIGGAGLSFLTVFFNAAIVEGMRGKRKNFSLALVLFFVFRFFPQPVLKTQGPALSAALVQPCIGASQKWEAENAEEIYRRLLVLGEEAAAKGADIIVWPEAAAPDYLLSEPEAFRKVSRFFREHRVFGMIGALHRQGGSSYNALLFFDRQGNPVSFYGKRHLVPFGEYVPLRGIFDTLSPVVAALGEFDRGEKSILFDVEGKSFAPLICYEVIFPEEVRRAAKGADVLVNVSNDAWYGATAAPWQHAKHALLRSAELGLPLLRCANNGLTFEVDARGKVKEMLPWNEQGVLVFPVSRQKARTFYAWVGEGFFFLAMLFGLGGFMGFKKIKRKKSK